MQTDHAATVLRLICRGLDRNTILTYAAENQWSETWEEIDQLIEEAFTEIAKHATGIDVDVEFGVAMLRLNRLFMDALKVQDLKTALQVQKEIDKILDLKIRARNPAQREQPATGERPRLTIAK